MAVGPSLTAATVVVPLTSMERARTPTGSLAHERDAVTRYVPVTGAVRRVGTSVFHAPPTLKSAFVNVSGVLVRLLMDCVPVL